MTQNISRIDMLAVVNSQGYLTHCDFLALFFVDLFGVCEGAAAAPAPQLATKERQHSSAYPKSGDASAVFRVGTRCSISNVFSLYGHMAVQPVCPVA